MKKLIIIFIALVTLQVTAQEKMKDAPRERKEAMKDLTPDEIATLQTKKMTLHLGLTEAQQKEIKALNLEQAKLHKAKMEERKAMKDNSERKPFTKEDKLKMMNERLDHQIAMKQKMKSILNADQYAKWEASQGKKMEHQKGMKKKIAKQKIEKEKNKQ